MTLVRPDSSDRAGITLGASTWTRVGVSHRRVRGLLLGLALIVAPLSHAAGPARIATSDRTLWPYALVSEKLFDLASRAEIIAFANAWARGGDASDPEEWSRRLGLKTVNTASIRRWRDRTGAIFSENFRQATLSCQGRADLFCPRKRPRSWADLVAYATSQWSKLPVSLTQWASEQQRFYETYLYEQERLAALFPEITSEILRVDDSEVLGTNYPDKSFLLTFDDGPTAAGGDTDQTIRFLRDRHMTAVFFLLGDRIKSRLGTSSAVNVRQLYEGMCIASHGWIHHPHPKMPDWRESIDTTDAELTTILPAGQEAVKYFRPPYGQRTPEISQYVVNRHQQDMLWNIDSQDWNAHVTPEQVTGRMISLMLLWRHGILLFHDVHPKAKQVLPAILSATENSGIHWTSCR